MDITEQFPKFINNNGFYKHFDVQNSLNPCQNMPVWGNIPLGPTDIQFQTQVKVGLSKT